MTLFTRGIFVWIIFSISTALAEVPPDTLITQAVERLISELTERKTELEADRAQLYLSLIHI